MSGFLYFHPSCDRCPLRFTQGVQHVCLSLHYQYSVTRFLAAWGIGFATVTAINLCSTLGFFFKPIMGTPIYKRVMMYMVSLAVGTLSGNALMILIPEVRYSLLISHNLAFKNTTCTASFVRYRQSEYRKIV